MDMRAAHSALPRRAELVNQSHGEKFFRQLLKRGVMSQPLRQINKALTSLSATRKLDEEKVIALLVSIRSLVESESKQSLFPTLWFYCNWCVHPRIERGLTKEWLAKISKAMGETPSDAWYSDKIAKVMGLDKLRAELIQLFRSKNSSLFLFESASNWRVFVRTMCMRILDTPLIRDDITPPDSDHRFWVVSLRLDIAGNNPLLEPTLADQKIKRGTVILIMDCVYNDVDNKYPQNQKRGENFSIFVPLGIPEVNTDFRFP